MSTRYHVLCPAMGPGKDVPERDGRESALGLHTGISSGLSFAESRCSGLPGALFLMRTCCGFFYSPSSCLWFSQTTTTRSHSCMSPTIRLSAHIESPGPPSGGRLATCPILSSPFLVPTITPGQLSPAIRDAQIHAVMLRMTSPLISASPTAARGSYRHYAYIREGIPRISWITNR